MNTEEKSLVIVGATGAVGEEVINCLHDLDFPIKNLRLVASERSEGRKINTPFGEIEIETASKDVFENSDIAIFSAGSSVSENLAPQVRESNCIMIDNSSAFRYDEEVPLVIPEINPEEIQKHQGLIANPNCTTTIAAVALWPLHQEFGLSKVIVSTYQSASGAGKRAMKELIDQTKQNLSGKEEESIEFNHSLAFNIIPHIGSFRGNNYTKEEMKVLWEMRKIFNDNSIDISCTAVRIPVLRAHSEAITIETKEKIDPESARKILEDAKGVEVVDNPNEKEYPMPRNASKKYDIEVGRIRQSLIFNDHGLDIFVSGDQLLKGAALNAVQIAKLFT